MEVVSSVERAEKSWRNRTGELQRELVCLNTREHINKIFRVECDRCAFALNFCLNVRSVIANVRGGGDVNRPASFCSDRKADDVRRCVGNNLRKLYSAKEVVADDDRLRCV